MTSPSISRSTIGRTRTAAALLLAALAFIVVPASDSSAAGPAVTSCPAGWIALDHPTRGPDERPLTVDIRNASKRNGARAIVWPAHDRSNQVWCPKEITEDHFRLRARHSGKCLDATDAGRVVQWTCHEYANQQWIRELFIDYWGFRHYQLRNVGSGQCLDIPGSGGRGTRLVVWKCRSEPARLAWNQMWNWRSVRLG